MADCSTFVKIIFQNKTVRRLWILPSNHFIRQIIVNSNKGFCAQSLIGPHQWPTDVLEITLFFSVCV